jgi:hypothetical protein
VASQTNLSGALAIRAATHASIYIFKNRLPEAASENLSYTPHLAFKTPNE